MEGVAEGMALISILIIGGSLAIGVIVFVMWIVLCSNVGRIRTVLMQINGQISEMKMITKESKKIQEEREGKETI